MFGSPYFYLFIGILFLLDSYLWNVVSKLKKKKLALIIQLAFPLTTLMFVLALWIFVYRAEHEIYNVTKSTNILIGLGIGFLFTKLILFILFLLEDIFRLSKFSVEKIISKNRKDVRLQGRRDFVRNLSLGVATLPLLGSIYAITKGKYNFQTKKVSLFLHRFPTSLNGLKIVQFTDFHAGSFDDYEKVKEGLQRINDEKPDLIFFTGDLVNNRSSEVFPYAKLFSNLSATYGKFAILGNHDYGDYVPFENEEERTKNLQELEDFYKETGFQLLNNENKQLTIGKETIDLIGVENWGSGRFPKYGDIDKAIQKLPKNRFNILLSHDPDHWEYILLKHPHFFDLTLSGHTHGSQVGINSPLFKWSPVQYRYKRWLGLYEENNQYLYVSKGIGFLGFPGRIGMLPEIVSFTLYGEG